MNIFVLDNDPALAARLQCDKHVVKMILETAQLLSTAHRLIDGVESSRIVNGKRKRVWEHPDASMDSVLYGVTHVNHPCAIWARQSDSNYNWLYTHFKALCDEYTYRYGKRHLSDEKLRQRLSSAPLAIRSAPLSPQPCAMGAAPECINVNDVVGSYRAFYMTKQERFKMVWTKRIVPEWFIKWERSVV